MLDLLSCALRSLQLVLDLLAEGRWCVSAVSDSQHNCCSTLGDGGTEVSVVDRIVEGVTLPWAFDQTKTSGRGVFMVPDANDVLLSEGST